MCKKIAWLLGLMLFILPTAFAFAGESEPTLYPFSMDGRYYLMDSDGGLVSGSEHDVIYALDADGMRYFIASKIVEVAGEPRLQSALMDSAGTLLTDYLYDYISFNTGCFLAQVGDAFGALDMQGNILLPVEYTQIYPTGQGTFIVSSDELNTGAPVTRCLIDSAGNSSEIELRNGYIGSFVEGIAPALDEQGGAGCIDAQGEWLVAPTLAYVSDFHDGLAVASTLNGLVGAINTHGEWAIAPEMTWISEFKNGMALASVGNYTGIIDSSGNWILPANYDTISLPPDESSLILASRNEDITFFDRTTFLPTAVRSSTNYFILLGNDLAAIYYDDRCTICRADGSEIASFTPECYVFAIDANLIGINEEGFPEKASIIDINGNVIAGDLQAIELLTVDNKLSGISVAHINSRETDGVIMPIYTSSRYGLLAADGRTLLPYSFDSISAVAPGLFSVRQNEYYGLMDQSGNWRIQRSDYDSLQD